MYPFNRLPRQNSVPYVTNIDTLTQQNNAYRRVIWTGDELQLVVMSIPPMGDIPLERHDAEDQFIRVEQGQAWAIVGPNEQQLNQQWILEEDDVLLIPKGYAHYIKNLNNAPLKLYTLYAPPHHPPHVIEQLPS
ncbi:hypothetical protein GCM10012290_16640 [Halolactibacillus alkaliphilus]|uniref:Cupin type-2 domain-containing protein n=1 Tax=Halolactibacillus alkaliphilus TaxID=442899 RepID=A0A511X225_9BACI|nr:cupin domain-containing protein [Halolactibacillus alkaliphilus]GEN56981.1 hypothetical protein HAL01_14450 [Halolactibacillus alkaliphilus]GGN71582.1 hypothetical protein GCM10012290_16640 [Halolactibacillus alkaliphilus]SFO84743.1 Mannose-6-phosphate isomerase, cupin superfamily [Halolactibacillus alkaliphilus]